MAEVYIQRTLVAEQKGIQRAVSEADLVTLGFPLVVLGDAGMGKTRLTEALAKRLGARRVSAGTFNRMADPGILRPVGESPIIIDGLDEITAVTGSAAVDAVLAKLSLMGYPPFILSCRAADWNGSSDRHKIREDYGVDPVTARLEPFSRDDAHHLLTARGLAAEALLHELDIRGLDEFYKNPLTLTLVAELAEDEQGLPDGRADLLDQASRLLVREDNAIHQRSKIGVASVDELLSSAGAVFAHLLLSGSQGVADCPSVSVPPGFVPLSEIGTLKYAPMPAATVKTRLFRSSGENQFVPYHRVIAEFLAGKWLAQRLDSGLSQRRAIQLLTVAGGVPTALRGVHAWFSHFAPRMTDSCIRADSYGVLRYGDPGRLKLGQARLLLQSLGALANEDPYFRSEDWGRRAIAGLARTELKAEILDLLKQPDRHVHLSSLVLEALPGSALTNAIVPELRRLIEDENAIYVERSAAADALAKSGAEIDWIELIRKLRAGQLDGGKRLALETVPKLDWPAYPSADVADALLDYHGVFREGRREEHVLGADYSLIRQMSPAQAAAVMDVVAKRLASVRRGPHWRMGYGMAWAVLRLSVKALESPTAPNATLLWSWLRLIEGERGLHKEEHDRIDTFLMENGSLRREIQRLAFADDDLDGRPWLAIAMYLPQISCGLAVSQDDAVFFMDEIANREALSNFDVELWVSLVRILGGHEGFPLGIEEAARRGIARHPELQRHWDELTTPPLNDWQKREELRQRKAEREREGRFAEQRAEFAKHLADIASGKAFGALYSITRGYLGRYYDLDREVDAVARLRDWLGNDLTEAALSGLVAVLRRPDLPSAKMIGETHAEGRTYNAESVLICGIAELLRTGRSLDSEPREVLKAALAALWETPESVGEKSGEKLRERLEAAVLVADNDIKEFFKEAIEPVIAAGRDYVPGLYQLSREERYKKVAGDLALGWLVDCQNAKPSVQEQLIETAIRMAQRDAFRTLVRERTASADIKAQAELRAMWTGALFAVDFNQSRELVEVFCEEDPASIWTLRRSIRWGRSERRLPLSINQLEFIVARYAPSWPSVDHPTGSWRGDTNPWDASDFIREVIGSLGSNKSKEATDALRRLSMNDIAVSYRDLIKHTLASQLRSQRDSDYQIPTFAEVRSTLAGDLPKTIDDLKAFVLDALETVQAYLRQGDTMTWRSFWSESKPNDENTCRDRLLDQLRSHISQAVLASPETLMPDKKRADIVVWHDGMGLPIEAKGQWHSDVWHAPSTQLIELYTKDYRAAGRGIYLVFWFGDVPGKLLPLHPGKKVRPSTPQELRQMLIEDLSAAERAKVDIVVIDISPTKK